MEKKKELYVSPETFLLELEKEVLQVTSQEVVDPLDGVRDVFDPVLW